MRLLLVSLVAIADGAAVWEVPPGFQCSNGYPKPHGYPATYLNPNWENQVALSAEECWAAVLVNNPDAEGFYFHVSPSCRELINVEALSPTRELPAEYGSSQGDGGICIPVKAGYFVDKHTKTCIRGSHQIQDEADCRAAATAVGLSFGIVDSWTQKIPPGCFQEASAFGGGGTVNFNTDDVGGVAESVSPVCKARYFVGAANTKTCPTGSNQILNEADCRAAATDVSLAFGGMRQEASAPPGCFTRTTDIYYAYFNTDDVGGVAESNSPVCQAVQAKPTFKLISHNLGGNMCVRKYQRRGWLKYGKCNGKELHFQIVDAGVGNFALMDVTSGGSGGCVRVQRKRLRLVSRCRTSSKNFQWEYVNSPSAGPERLLYSKYECVHIDYGSCGEKGCKPFTMSGCGLKDEAFFAWMVPIMIQAPAQ